METFRDVHLLPGPQLPGHEFWMFFPASGGCHPRPTVGTRLKATCSFQPSPAGIHNHGEGPRDLPE